MQRNVDIAQRFDLFTLLCLALTTIGWFGMNTLVVRFGHFTQSTRFYELGVVLLHPSALFVGVGDSHTFALAIFCVLTMLALLVALAAPAILLRPHAWLTGWLPLALMLTCFALLYVSGTNAPAAVVADNSLRDDLMRLASHTMLRTQNALAAHIGVGAGAVLSLVAGLLLGIRSTINYAAESHLPGESIRNAEPFSREPLSS